MLRPSRAPRWKIAIRRRFRASAAAATRVRNPGANPRESIAAAPDLMKMRLFVVIKTCQCNRESRITNHDSLLSPLKLRSADAGRVLRSGDHLRDVHPRDERAGR